MLKIRLESAADVQYIDDLLASAFPTRAEADLVARLRERNLLSLSLVAILRDELVGHLALSPVTLHDARDQPLMQGLGLAPVAVAPSHQGKGIGSALTQHALAHRQTQQAPFVVVLGHTDYYKRFGFARALDQQVGNEYGVDLEFMIVQLDGRSFPTGPKLAKYSAPFAEMA